MNIVINEYKERGTHFRSVRKVPKPPKQIETWVVVEWDQRNKISEATLEKMKRCPGIDR
jgi:DNA integrity scanning protein DisA with diadenylate cyclase activity